jgi:small subunit ribosomal protein S17
MSEDEQRKDQNEGVEQETPQDQGAQAAGPVAGEGTPSSPDGEPTPTPPAGEESGAEEAPSEEADAPVAEERETEESAAAEETPAATEEDKAEEPAAAEEEKGEEPAAKEEAPAEEGSPEDDLPWKERRRLERSRRPHEAGPQRSPEERVAERAAARKRRAGLRRTERAAAKAKKGTAGTGTPAAERVGNAAKVRQGIVVSDKGEKSITVRIDIVRRHPTYEKVVRRSRTLHAHDERNEAGEGDVVRVIETRPLSKTKRWRLVEVLERAK